MNKVVLIGDSIRKGYGPFVIEILRGEFEVSSREDNAGSSPHLLETLTKWIDGENPDIVHVNCGLHDLARKEELEPRVTLEEYERNVDTILSRLKAETQAKIVWATSTPVIDEWHLAVKLFERRQEDVIKYNATANKVAQRHGVEINDLHAVIESAGREKCLNPDGIHMNETGNRLLAEAVCACIRSVAAR